MKSAVMYEEAKRLFLEGYSLDSIVELLNNKISRRTLHNWRTEHEWDNQRKERASQTADLTQALLEIAKTAIQEAKANPSPHAIFAVVKAISAIKMFQGVDLSDPEKDAAPAEKGIKQDTIKLIEREILGLSPE